MSLWLAPMFAVSVERQQGEPRVITNSGQQIESISRDALRAIFGMRLQSWRNNKPTRVFVLKDNHPLHQAFTKQVLNIYPHQLRLAWDRLVYSGTGQAPIQVDSESEMLKRLKETPGAIGYLSSSMVDDSVRVLEIR
jgi:ABC-type phosphate transport system substrate-binding protein